MGGQGQAPSDVTQPLLDAALVVDADVVQIGSLELPGMFCKVGNGDSGLNVSTTPP